MSIVDRFLPPPGSPEAIRAAAEVWRDCAGRVRALGDGVTLRASVLSSSWSGSSKEAFVERTWPFLRQLDAAAAGLDRCAVVLDQLAGGIEAAQREYRARMVAVGATVVAGIALTIVTATLSDDAAAAAVTAELATATELAGTATSVASAALSALVTQAGQFALRVVVFSGTNVAADAVGAAVAYDDGRPRAHLHLRDDLEWAAIGALALPMGAAMLNGLAQRGVALNGLSGAGIKLGVGGLSMAQADVLVRSALGERVEPEELLMAGLPIAGAGHGGKPREVPVGGVRGIVNKVESPIVDGYPSSRLVPGGGLARHEKGGGHTLERHTGLTERELAARLDAEPALTRVGRFTDRATAERAVAYALERHGAEIRAWKRRDALELTTEYPGAGVSQRRGGPVRTANRVKIVLLPRSRQPGGWIVLTAYPVP